MENNCDSTEEAGNNNKKVSELRNVTSQCFAAVAISILKFSLGNYIGFNSILIVELIYKYQSADVKISSDELTWFTSYYFKSLGVVVLGILAQRIGCRSVLLIAAMSFSASWVIFHFATNSAMLMTAQALFGLTYLTVIGTGTTYVAESSQPRLRGILMSSSSLCISCGIFFTTLIGTMVHWRQAALVNLAFPLLGFAAVYCIPNTPSWLASKGRFDEAERALAWLRGWTTPEDVKSEFLALKAAHSRIERNITDTKTSSSKPNKWPYLDRSFYLPLATISCVFLLHNLAGIETVLTYSTLIFPKIEAPIDKHTTTAVFMAAPIVGSLVCIFAISFTGKRKLLFFSLFVAGLAYFVASLTIYQRTVSSSSLYYWLPTAMFVTLTFATSVGAEKVIYMLSSEFFPARFRNVGVSVGLLEDSIFAALVKKTFLYAVNGVGTQGVFLFFGSICVVALVTFYFIVPETEGRSLEEIEDWYRSKKKEVASPAETDA